MPRWHGDAHKRKVSGGKGRPHRTKRNYEVGSDAAETRLGDRRRVMKRVRGAKTKIRLLRAGLANVTDPNNLITKRVRIVGVVRNPARVDYDRRGIITKGTIIETPLGEAVVTSRPGQNGIVNAILRGKPGI